MEKRERGNVYNQVAETAKEYKSRSRNDGSGPKTDSNERPGKIGVKLDTKSVASLLQGRPSLSVGKLLHAYVIRQGLARFNFFCNLLVSMYAKCGALEMARSVFDTMNRHDVVSWTSIIAAHAQHGHKHEALRLFTEMQDAGIRPNNITFVTVLGACDDPAFVAQGEAIHASMAATQVESDVSLSTALVNMYGKIGNLQKAQEVFERMRQRNVASWTALITAYTKHGCGLQAFRLFREMQENGVKPNKITFVSLLGACKSPDAIADGEAIHACIVENGFESDVLVGNALINMYGKCGRLQDARHIFDRMNQHDVISWNTIIAAYAEHGNGKEALQLFRVMESEGVKPDKTTFCSILTACAAQTALAEGEQIHTRIVAAGFDSNVAVSNALATMYGRCGALGLARLTFDNMLERDVISWNTMIASYAGYGQGKEAFQLFQLMKEGNVEPNKVTFLSLLSACCHAGLLEEGCCIFKSMCEDYRITPTLQHYNCMIDLFGRAGHLDKAEEFIYKMPFQPNSSVWITLLSACTIHGDVERGKRAAKNVTRMEP